MSKDVNIYVLTGSGRLNPFKKQIIKSANYLLEIIKSKIPLPNMDIVFYDNPDGAIPHLGVGAQTINPNLVFISLDPDFQHFERVINGEVERILVHELHHCVRWQHPGYGKTLLQALISEGLADHFDIEVTKKKPQRWNIALTNKQMVSFRKKAKKEYYKKDYDHYSWFFGSKRKGIPKWTGYTIGFNIVGKYLKRHPDKKPSLLYATHAEEFIK